MNMKMAPIILFLSTLIFLLAACSQNKPIPAGSSPVPPADTNGHFAEEESLPQPPEASTIAAAYADVLQWNAVFLDTGTGQPLDIGHLSQAVTSDDRTAAVEQFAVVDLDHDHIPEVILQMKFEDSCTIGFEVLRCLDGEIYGYCFPYRAFGDLKPDGTVMTSGGAGDWGVCSITFSKDGYQMEDIARCQSSRSPQGGCLELYVVDGQQATEWEFWAAIDRRDQQGDVVWYAFTDHNIQNVVVPAMDQAQQLKLISQQAEMWQQAEHEDGWWGYTVTDLDRNGRLELITSHEAGSARLTDTLMWEVNERLDRLVPCPQDEACGLVMELREGWQDGQTFPVYYCQDWRGDRYYYILEDHVSGGAMGYYENIRAVTLEDGRLSGTFLAYKDVEYGPDQKENASYRDAGKAAISQEGYNAAAARHFEGYVERQAVIQWVPGVQGLSEAELYTKLENSYGAFAIE